MRKFILRMLNAASDGFTGAFRLFGYFAKLFLVYLPCLLFLSLPAFLIGYLWCWVFGGFKAGELYFEQDAEKETNSRVAYRFDITEPQP